MKICFIGPANSAHIIKWCTWFSERGHEVHVISFTSANIRGAEVHLIDIGIDTAGNDFSKLKYLFTGKKIRSIVETIKPDIVNVHYATSYGTAVALSGIKSYVLSVWGADIYDFPRKSILHKAMLRFSLKKASILFSTSKAMANEARKYTKKEFIITPFGVDMTLFNPDKRTREEDGCFVVGTVKALSDKYGIKDILSAVAHVRHVDKLPIVLRIAGKGPQEAEYHSLAETLKINSITTWVGFIDQNQAAKEWANMDLALIPSTLESESFGVSAVEAQSCGIPVIVSDIPGLMEATKPGITSVVIPRNDPQSLANAIVRLYNNKDIRRKMSIDGRQYVECLYEMNKCFEHIEGYFIDMLNNQSMPKFKSILDK